MLGIIEKIKTAGLKGRGGAGFPVSVKWSSAKEALKNKREKEGPEAKGYVVCNAAEGEPGVLKDAYILENYPEEVISGIKIAMETIGAEEAFINLRHDLFDKWVGDLKKIIGEAKIKILRESGGYLAGEETTMLETIEEKERREPRVRPPYPTEKGLWGFPTLVNNVETFYSVSLIAKGEYKNERFYTISGDIEKPGVFSLPEHWTIEKVLHKTGNFPQADFFVQEGGGVSGKILLENELTAEEVQGTGSIIVHLVSKTDPKELMKKWIEFFFKENCGKCVPCREGVYHIKEILERKEIHPHTKGLHSENFGVGVNMVDLEDVLMNLREGSFCPFGESVAMSFESLIQKIIKHTT